MSGSDDILEPFLSCPVCKERYDHAEYRPIVGRCGHSVCTACKNTSRLNMCPVCRAPRFLAHAVVNFALSGVLNGLNSVENDSENVRNRFNKSCFQCGACEYPVAEYRALICRTCGLKDGQLVCDQEDDVLKLNVERSIVDEIERDHLLCYHCSQTEPHKYHSTVRYLPVKLKSLGRMDAHSLFKDFCRVVGDEIRTETCIVSHRINSVYEELHLTMEKMKNPVSYREFEAAEADINALLVQSQGYLTALNKSVVDTGLSMIGYSDNINVDSYGKGGTKYGGIFTDEMIQGMCATSLRNIRNNFATAQIDDVDMPENELTGDIPRWKNLLILLTTFAVNKLSSLWQKLRLVFSWIVVTTV